MRRLRARHLSLAVSAFVALTTLACADGATPPAELAGVRSDSAGIEIVVHSVGTESVPAFATIDTLPELRLGSPMGQPEEQFGAIRDVVALPDGGLAVLDGQAAEVRLFDSVGRFRGVLGSKGQGPGEFQSPIALAVLPGDTLAVFDPVPRRVTRFGPDGATARITTLGDAQAQMSDGHFLSDGRLVGQSHWLAPGGASPPSAEPTLHRNTVVLTLYDAEGQVVDTIDVVPSGEEIVSIQLRPGAISVFKRPPVFARDNVFAPGPQGIWSSENDRFELRLRETTSGRLIRIIRAPSLERTASPEIAQSIYDRALAEAQTAAERSQLDTWFALSPQPEVQPAHDVLEIDDRGRLWVREWSPFGSGTRWWVFQSDGTVLGSVDARSGMRITSVACGSVLGVEQDELGVDYAVRYAIHGDVVC